MGTDTKGDGTTADVKCGVKIVKRFLIQPYFEDPTSGEKIYPKVKFVKVDFRVNALSRDPRSEKMPKYEDIAAFMKTQNDKAPEGMNNMIQGSGAWRFMPTEKMLVQNAIQGIIIAVAFAFAILLFATGNIIVSAVSIFCVALVILSIVA